MNDFQPYPFESATLTLLPIPIVPPSYKLVVRGMRPSLGGEIKLVRSNTLKDGYIQFQVVGQSTEAIGSTSYIVDTQVSQEHDTKGVLVKGAQGKEERIAWPLAELRDTDNAHTQAAAELTSLSQLESATVIPSSIRLNPSLLQVLAQAPGFNYRLSVVPADNPGLDPAYWPYWVVQTKTGPGWPSDAGIGPVIPPKSVTVPINRVGSKGVLVVGSNQSIALEAKAFLPPKS